MKKQIAIYVLVLLAIVGIVWAADVKISDMVLEPHPDGGDLVPIVDVSGSTNRKTTIYNLIQSGVTTISGTTLDWTTGVTLPRLAGVTESVQTQINTLSGTVATGEVSKAMLDAHTNPEGFTDSLGGVSNFAPKASLTDATALAAFSGTTWFTTHAEVAANTVTLSGASGEATKAQLATHTDADAFATSTGGVSNFALKSALTASNELVAFTGVTWFVTHPEMAANTVVVSGTSLDLSSGITTTSGVTVGTILWPDTNDGATIGWPGTAWSDLYLADGGVINWNNGFLTLTQSTNYLYLSGSQALYDLRIGASDTKQGGITLYGDNANAGGVIQFYNGANYDTNSDSYLVGTINSGSKVGEFYITRYGSEDIVLNDKNGSVYFASGISVESSVSANVLSGASIIYRSGVTGDYLIGAPNFQSGASSYVLTSIGVGKIPIWTNAPAGTGSSSNVFESGLSTSGISVFHTPAFDKSPIYIHTDQDNIAGVSMETTANNGKIGISMKNDSSTWRILNDGADGDSLKFYKDGTEIADIDENTFVLNGAFDASGNISGATIYSYATDSIGGIYLYTKDIGGNYVLLKINGGLAGNYTLTLPLDDGDSGEVLMTDGAGNLDWTANGEVSKAMLDGHTNDGAFSGTSNFALKAALTASNAADAFSGTTGFALKTALTASTDLAAFSGTTGFATHVALAANTASLSGASGEATKTMLDNHTNPAAFSGTSNFALKTALTASVEAAAFKNSGTTDFALRTSLGAAQVSGASIEWSGVTLGYLVNPPDFDSSGTSGSVLISGASGTRPNWSTELNISLVTTGAQQVNRILYFDANGTMSGATNVPYSGVTNTIDFSGTTVVIRSGTSPDYVCQTGTVYLDTDADTNGSLYMCVATGVWKEIDDDGGAVEVTKALLDAHTNDGAFSGTSNFALKAALTAAVEAAAFSGTTGFALHTSLAANTVTLSGVSGEATKAQLATHSDAAAFASSTGGVSNFATKAALTASVATNAVSGVSLDWTSGTSLPLLAGYPSYSGTSSYVLTARGTNATPIFTNLPSTTAEVSKDMLDGHTNDGSFSGTSNFALKSALTASTNSLSGVSGEATKAQLASHTDAAAYESSTGGVSNFATKAATTTALNATSFSGTTGFALKTALTESTDLAAFSGTTGFATHTALAANTVALSGVSGEATKAQLNTHTDAAAYASSTGGVSNFATKAALTASTGSAVVSGTSIDWTSGTSLQYIAGATSFIQTQIIAISGTSNVLPQTVGKQVGGLYYDTTQPQVVGYGTVNGGATEFVVSSATDFFSFVISGVTHGKNAQGVSYRDQDDILLFKPPYPIVVKEVFGIVSSGTTVLWNIMNCDQKGDNCTDMLAADIQSGSTGNLTPGANYNFVDSAVTKEQYLRVDFTWSGVSTTSGVTANFTGTVNYWKQRE